MSAPIRLFHPGEALPEVVWPAISRTTLALYAGGSGDHNPLHLDPDFARAAGLPDVIGHGMLTMALLGRYLTSVTSQRALRTFQVRFLSMAQLGDTIVCQGKVVDVSDVAGERHATLEVTAATGSGVVLAAGAAVAAQP